MSPAHTTLLVQEYEEIELPSSLIDSSGTIRVFDGALSKDYFSIRLKRGRLVLQAGGYVGLVSLNQHISLDIRPKVPLGSIERMMLYTHDYSPITYFGQRSYSASSHAPRSITEFLWKEFVGLTERIHELGLYKKYSECRGSSNSPRGRINPVISAMESQVRGRSVAHCSWQEKTSDIPVNRLIKFVLREIEIAFRGSVDKDTRRRISFCLSHFDSVELDTNKEFLSDREVVSPGLIPGTRDYYVPAVNLAKIILNGEGISFTSDEKKVAIARSLLINMEVVFEVYIREVLLRGLKSDFIEVKDGNKGGAGGGRKPLLRRTPLASQLGRDIEATPDVVLVRHQEAMPSQNIVIDVKYKGIREVADRADINQLITYAASYGSSAAVLVFPRLHSNQQLLCLGEFDGVLIFQYFYDLKTAAHDAEDARLVEFMSSLFPRGADAPAQPTM